MSTRPTAAAVAIIICLWMPSPAVAADNLESDAAGSPDWQTTFHLRPRYNRIDESNRPERTEGWTVRAIAGIDARPIEDWRLRLELLHTDHLGAKRFNDDVSRIASSPYPLLPDPRTTDLNQAYIEYRGLPDTQVRIGQQLVKLGNERMLSDNDFRQIPTAFTGVMVVNNTLPRTEVRLGYFERVRTALAAQSPLTLSVVNVAHNLASAHSLSAYGYWLDQPATGSFTGFADNSHRTVGMRAEGVWLTGDDWSLPYTLEWAGQRAYAGGNAAIDAHYRRVGFGFSVQGVTVRADEEVRGSPSGRYAFQMPYADFYAYNGWTLQFISAPAQGLKDRWLSARYEWRRLTFYAEEHRFAADRGGAALARERDLSALVVLDKHLFARLQHAAFRPEPALLGGKSVTKTWLTLQFNY